jgi:hypothetical protein
VYPQLQRFGVMHAKIVVVKFNSGKLRVSSFRFRASQSFDFPALMLHHCQIAITSANLTEVDWDMYMQNVWFQDFSQNETECQQSYRTQSTHCFQPVGPQGKWS